MNYISSIIFDLCDIIIFKDAWSRFKLNSFNFYFSYLMFMKIGISDGQPTFESQLLSYQGQTLLAIFVM